jgi:sugar transferase (PEP-CTERM/EpsH1 system associated)
VHRIPFPPNKGDKIRSYHLLKHLSSRYDVHLGTFVDMPEDMVHADELRAYCRSHLIRLLDPRVARLRSVSGLLTGEALTLPYYRDGALQEWVDRTIRTERIRKAVVFSGAMEQYVRDRGLRVVLDFVDVDSAKWSEYAKRHSWPSSVIYRREGKRLLSFERAAARRSAASVFVTRAEADLFLRLAPECTGKVCVAEMGVDIGYFSPDPSRVSPFTGTGPNIVFTGAMDYWPNIDAVTWFASEVLPLVLRARPDARFYIVGMNPTPAVVALRTRPGTVVTGKVPDVRPYLQHASVVIAPLRVARGIQSKVLEAMAMERPVVITAAASSGLSGLPGTELEIAVSPEEFAQKVLSSLDPATAAAMGRRARSRIVDDYSWARNLAVFEGLLECEESVPAQAAN